MQQLQQQMMLQAAAREATKPLVSLVICALSLSLSHFR
jgi:hypothetical protein